MLLRPGSSAVGGGDDEAYEGAAAGNRPAVERIDEHHILEREAGAIRVEDLPGPAAVGGALEQTSSHSDARKLPDGACRLAQSVQSSLEPAQRGAVAREVYVPSEVDLGWRSGAIPVRVDHVQGGN